MKNFVDGTLFIVGLLLASAEHEGPLYLFTVNLVGVGMIWIVALRSRREEEEEEGREL